MTDWLPLLHDIADAADRIALQHFRTAALAVDTKPDASPVTVADRGIEAVARRLLHSLHPGLAVLGEEEGETGSGERRLIIDPIDGTRNFVRGVPVFATLLAIEEGGAVVAGVVSAPALGQRWHATRGGGAWNGARRLAVSPVNELGQAHLFHGSVGGAAEGGPPSGLLPLAQRVARTRGFGDFYQHVLVADGAGEIAVDHVVKAWDVAPLVLLVEEAGGQATSLTGEHTIHGGSLLTSNGRLHAAALEALRPRS